MLEKIKVALGETAEQVEGLLKAAGIELAVMNDGSVVPADKFDGMKQELKDANGTITKIQDDMKALSTSTESAEEFKTKLAEKNKEFEDYRLDIGNKEIQRGKESKLDELLRTGDKKVIENLLDIVKSRVDYNQISVDSNGQYIGINDVVDNLRNNYKEAFSLTETTGTPPGNSQGTGTPETWTTKLAGAKTNLEKIKIKQDAQKEGVSL